MYRDSISAWRLSPGVPVLTGLNLVDMLIDAYLLPLRHVISKHTHDSDVLQGSVATHIRCDGIFNNSFIANFQRICQWKFAFSAVRKSIRPVKNWVMRCWCGYLSGARCRLFAYGPVDATASSSSLASFKSRLVLPFWYRLTQVVL